VITTTGLTKRYGKVLAVDGVELRVGEGDRYGLIGPNGAGKTTLLRLLLGLVYATSGEIEVMGQPVPRRLGQVLPQVGGLVEGAAAYGHLSGRANLALLDAAGPGGERRTRKSRISAALERVGLGGIDGRPFRAYSLGMRQRLGLAGALMRTPRLLVLDEPTNGLDPQGIREMRDLLQDLNRDGTTILLSSHLLAEVEQLCTRIGVIDGGRLVLQEDLATLQAGTGRVVVRTPDADQAVGLLDGRVESRAGDRLLVRHTDPAELNTMLVAAGLRIGELGPERRTLEEIVLATMSAGSDRIDSAAPKPSTPAQAPTPAPAPAPAPAAASAEDGAKPAPAAADDGAAEGEPR
jgi:ABC-2 type transport system ATP-binding protein